MSDVVAFNDSDSIKKSIRNKKLVIAVVVLILILVGLLAWALTHKKPIKKQTPNSLNSSNVIAKPTPEQIKLAKENIGTSGKIVSINTNTKTITLKKADNSQVDYIYNDKSTVHKSVSNLDASFSDLKEGLDVSLSYEETSNGSIVKDVWYLK